MSFRGGLTGGFGSALYGPRISRSIVDQLESHLRTLDVVATETNQDRIAGRCEGPVASTNPHASGHLRIDQLENALLCVKKAARTMAELDQQAVPADERAGMQSALAALERRLHSFEREFAMMSERLRDARRETEDYKERTLVAETKLDSLMAAVARMIAPLGSRKAVARHRSPPTLRGALANDEVRA